MTCMDGRGPGQGWNDLPAQATSDIFEDRSATGAYTYVCRISSTDPIVTIRDAEAG